MNRLAQTESSIDSALRQANRFHGKQLAIFIFGFCIFFSFMSAYHFDLVPPDALDYIDLSPTIHVKDMLSRKLSAAKDKDMALMQGSEWESTVDEASDYRDCKLNGPPDRPKHGCTTDRDTHIPYCQVQNLRIDVTRISGPQGGEPLDTVMAREEDVEFPKYLTGAFSTDKRLVLSADMNRDYWMYLLDVFMALDITRKNKCKTKLSGITLLTTRYEYVDLYHTLKDLWNAFLVLPPGVKKVDRVIFLDAHAQGHYDSIWTQVFGPTMHVKQLDDDTCLEHAIFIPPGYSSVLWHLGRLFEGHRCPAMAEAFVKHVVESYGLQKLRMQEQTVLLIDQVPHITHPRSKQDESHNSEEMQRWETEIMDQTEAISGQVIDLEKLSFKSQLKLVRQAQILIGEQGSPLALNMFLPDGATLMELRDGGNTDNEEICKWRPRVNYVSLSKFSSNILGYEILPNVKDVVSPGWDKDIKRYPEKYYEDLEQELNMTDDEFGDARDNLMADDFVSLEENLIRSFDPSSLTFDEETDYRKCGINGPYPRPTHGCSLDEDKLVPFCNFKDLRLDVSLMTGAKGGEPLDTVMGREEDVEFPTYKKGAFSVLEEPDIPESLDRSMFHYLGGVVDALTVSSSSPSCSRTVTEPTMFITRYEYVNLYHSLTDWWNAFFSLPDGEKKVRVVFLDSHAEGLLDNVWTQVFGEFEHVMKLEKGGVCFKEAIFIPAGYSTVLWPKERYFKDKRCRSMTDAFVSRFVKSFNVGDVELDKGLVTIIDRQPYISHPRSKLDNSLRQVFNLNRLADRIRKETNATKVELVQLETLPFQDQLRLIRKSHVLLGQHGAGISFLMFLSDGAHLMELQQTEMMEDLARWKPKITYKDLGTGLVENGQLADNDMSRKILPSINFALNEQDEAEESPESVMSALIN